MSFCHEYATPLEPGWPFHLITKRITKQDPRQTSPCASWRSSLHHGGSRLRLLGAAAVVFVRLRGLRGVRGCMLTNCVLRVSWVASLSWFGSPGPFRG